MARGTLNFCSDVRRVIETDVGFIGPSVNPLPWNFFAAHLIGGDFLDFRFIGRNCLMAHHAILDAGNACNGTLRHPDVAKITLELGFFNVGFVLIGDRLNWFGANSEKMSNRLTKRLMRG